MTICPAADATSAASNYPARCPAPAAPSSTAAGPASKRPTGSGADALPEPPAPTAASSKPPQASNTTPGPKFTTTSGAKSLDYTQVGERIGLMLWRSGGTVRSCR